MFVGVNEQAIMQKVYEKVVHHSQIRGPAPRGGREGEGGGSPNQTSLHYRLNGVFVPG